MTLGNMRERGLNDAIGVDRRFPSLIVNANMFGRRSM
jgi:hypothetical protein